MNPSCLLLLSSCTADTIVPQDLISKMLQIDPSERASIPEIFNHSWIRSINNSSFHYSEALSLKPAVPGLRGTVPVAAPVIENASPKIGRQTFFSSPKGESRAEAREETNYNSEGIASEAFRSPIISPKVLLTVLALFLFFLFLSKCFSFQKYIPLVFNSSSAFLFFSFCTAE